MQNIIGEYCGPYWSDGKLQRSVAGKATARSAMDQTCKDHDRAYAKVASSNADEETKRAQLNFADVKFYKENMGQGPLRSAAAIAVGSNLLFRKKSGQHVPLDIIKEHKTNHIPIITPKLELYPKSKNTMSQRKNRKNNYRANNTVTKAPVATSKTVRIGKPKMSTVNGTTFITHREYVGQVMSNTGTLITSHRLNPGNGAVFNWLSGIAIGYEEYRFKKLSFTYVSAAATSERGRVALAFQYDPTADSPGGRADLFSIVPNVEEAPWEDIELRVPVSNEYKYVRVGDITTGTYNTYDTGKLHVLTAMNADSTTQLGELFVEYTAELRHPQFLQLPAGEIAVVNSSATNPLGTSFVLNGGNSILKWAYFTQMYLNTTKPLLVEIVFTGTVLAMPNPTITLVSGSAGTISVKSNVINAAGTNQTIVFTTKYTNTLDKVTFAAGAATTIIGATIRQACYTSG